LEEYKSRRPEKIDQFVENIQIDEKQEGDEKRRIDPRSERFLTQLRQKHPQHSGPRRG
jgi:hypothetical protein